MYSDNKSYREKENKEEQPKREMPVRVISSLIFLVSFIIMLIMFFTDDGVFTNLIANFVRGLIGQIGFAILIPALLYAFIIHAFSGDRPIIMRTICLFCFVFLSRMDYQKLWKQMTCSSYLSDSDFCALYLPEDFYIPACGRLSSLHTHWDKLGLGLPVLQN